MNFISLVSLLLLAPLLHITQCVPLTFESYDLPPSFEMINTTFTNISNIILFGDSLSDNGNVFNASNNSYPASPYYDGRWSNGPTWVEYLANATNATLYDYAFGGSEACSTFVENGTTRPNLQDQIQLYKSNVSTPFNGTDDLYVVWIGSNDFFNAASNGGQFLSGLPERVAGCVENGVKTILDDFSPKTLMILNLPPIGQTPFVQKYSSLAIWIANQVSDGYNEELKSKLRDLEQQYNQTSFIYVDTNAMFKDTVSEASSFNLSNTNQACYSESSGNVCNEPESYVFWDGVYPTTHTHRILAQFVSNNNSTYISTSP